MSLDLGYKLRGRPILRGAETWKIAVVCPGECTKQLFFQPNVVHFFKNIKGTLCKIKNITLTCQARIGGCGHDCQWLLCSPRHLRLPACFWQDGWALSITHCSWPRWRVNGPLFSWTCGNAPNYWYMAQDVSTSLAFTFTVLR